MNIIIPEKIRNYLGNLFLRTNNELAGFLIYDKIYKINDENIFNIYKVIVNEGNENNSIKALTNSLLEMRINNPDDEKKSIPFHTHSRKSGSIVEYYDVYPSNDDFILPQGLERTPQYGIILLIKPKNDLINKAMPDDLRYIDFIVINQLKRTLSNSF